MKAMFSIVSLLVVLGIVMITVRQQMRASRLAAAPAASSDASAPFGGASQPTTAQYEKELHRALDAGMATRASQAEAAGSEP